MSGLDAASELCLACGLCCEGSLFLYVRLDEEEEERLRTLGAEVFRRKSGLRGMRLGCNRLEGTRCGVYPQRPRGCRAFFCLQAAGVRDGHVAPAVARERVEQARALIAEVAGSLPPAREGEPSNPLQRAREVGLLDGPEKLRRAEEHLAEHFLGVAAG